MLVSEKAGGGLAANTDHCAELAIDRAVDREIGNGTDKGVVIAGTKRGAKLLPAAPDLPVALCREGRRDFGAQMSGCLPPLHSLQTHPNSYITKPATEPGQAQVWADGEQFGPLYTRDSLWLAKPLLPVLTAHLS